MDELLPWPHLKGISTGDFGEALEALVGPQARGLSSSMTSRLKQVWTQEYEEWSRRDLRGKRFVYLWIDGIYCQARLEEEKHALRRKDCFLNTPVASQFVLPKEAICLRSAQKRGRS